jgi:hypothetical protein
VAFVFVEAGSVRARAAEELAFIHRAARMVFELQETAAIIEAWNKFAEESRAQAVDPETADRELVSVLVAVLYEAKRMAIAHVAEAAEELSDALDALRQRLDQSSSGMDEQDKLGNFEIQDLMSDFNAAETLASSVQKKLDCTANAIIGKI